MPLSAPDTDRFVGIVMYVPASDRVQTWPVHNYAATIPFTRMDKTQGDYGLATPYWMDTSDGKLAGVDMIKTAKKIALVKA